LAFSIKNNAIFPEWHAPAWVQAVSTTRVGGYSEPPYDSFNLARHVGDQDSLVEKNRDELVQALSIPNPPYWLEQVHSKLVVPVEETAMQAKADGSYTDQAGRVCVVMTADCLPVLMVNRKQRKVAALHAGWKGLAAGILEQGIHCIGNDDTIAWMGPAIGAKHFEVGKDVYAALVDVNPDHSKCFEPVADDKWLADIYELARQKMYKVGVKEITGGQYCTYTDKNKFFSYRRDKTTGRMASLIWMMD
jgi:YfiH family protein